MHHEDPGTDHDCFYQSYHSCEVKEASILSIAGAIGTIFGGREVRTEAPEKPHCMSLTDTGTCPLGPRLFLCWFYESSEKKRRRILGDYVPSSLPTEVPKLPVSFASMVVGGTLRVKVGVRQVHKNRGKTQVK